MSDSDRTVVQAPRRVLVTTKPSPEDVEPGTRAGDCVIMREIAAGGCGTVYEAQHLGLGCRVAVKVLLRRLAGSANMVMRFFREARVVQQLRHPNIVEVHGFGELDDGRPYIVMELLPGEHMGGLLKRHGRLSPREALAYLEPVCEALSAAHRAGIVHRDLKASNIAVLYEGDDPKVKLLDFGIAKLMRPDPGDRDLTAVGQRVGSPLSMAPEQLLGDMIGPGADIYALGALLFRLLTGTHPFQANDLREIERLHLKAPPPRPSSLAPVSPLVDDVVLRCLAKRPEKRFGSVEEFLDALQVAVGEPRENAQPVSAEMHRKVVIHLEIALFEGIDENDAHLMAIGQLLDDTEAELQGSGFRLRQSTGNAIVAERILDDDPLAAQAERAQALALVRSVAARGTPLRAGSLNVRIHGGDAQEPMVI